MLTKYFSTQIEKAPEGLDLITDLSGEAAYAYEFRNGEQLLRFIVDDVRLHVEVVVRGDPEAYEHWIWEQGVEDDYAPEEVNQTVCAAIGTAVIDEVKAGAELEECFADYKFWQEA